MLEGRGYGLCAGSVRWNDSEKPGFFEPNYCWVREGRSLTAAVEFFERMLEKDTVAINAMIDAFVKFGDVNFAKKLFDEMTDRSVVSWPSLIAGYTGGRHEGRESVV